MIHDTAIVAVEKRFGITLSRENIKFPKMKFKGYFTILDGISLLTLVVL